MAKHVVEASGKVLRLINSFEKATNAFAKPVKGRFVLILDDGQLRIKPADHAIDGDIVICKLSSFDINNGPDGQKRDEIRVKLLKLEAKG